jgi:hypothetical protein
MIGIWKTTKERKKESRMKFFSCILNWVYILATGKKWRIAIFTDG